MLFVTLQNLVKKFKKFVAFSECINSFQKYKFPVVKKSAISIGIPKTSFQIPNDIYSLAALYPT